MRNYMTLPLVLYGRLLDPDNRKVLDDYIAMNTEFNSRIRKRQLFVYGGSAQGAIIPKVWNVHDAIGVVTSVVWYKNPHINFKLFDTALGNSVKDMIMDKTIALGLTPDFICRVDPYNSKKIIDIVTISRFGITTNNQEETHESH